MGMDTVFERDDGEWEFWRNTAGSTTVTIKIPTEHLPLILEQITEITRQIIVAEAKE